MEKYGVIRPDLTPAENDDNSGKIEVKTASVKELDNDFRKRAAEAAEKKTQQ